MWFYWTYKCLLNNVCILGILRQPLAGDALSQQALELLRKDMGIDVTPQYLVESKKPVEAGASPQFKKQDRPNTTESFTDYQVSVSIFCLI